MNGQNSPDAFQARLRSFRSDERPLDDQERQWCSDVIDRICRNGQPAFYHGGIDGLSIGDLLLPPDETGNDPRQWHDKCPGAKRFVYFTDCPERADFYARTIRLARLWTDGPPKTGIVYRVSPIGHFEIERAEIRAHRSFGHTPEMAAEIGKLAFICKGAEIIGFA